MIVTKKSNENDVISQLCNYVVPNSIFPLNVIFNSVLNNEFVYLQFFPHADALVQD